MPEIEIAKIVVGPRLRAFNEQKVSQIAESMRELGQLHPIILTADMRLIAGLHRLKAAERLGMTEIKGYVTIEEPEIVEIDENLARADLTPAEVAKHVSKRKEIWERVKREEKENQCVVGGNTVPTKKPQHEKGFAADTAEKTGLTKRHINQAAKRGNDIAPDVLDAVQGTDLDKGTKLDELAKLPPEEQREEIKKPKVKPVKKTAAQKLFDAYCKLNPTQRQEFLAIVELEEGCEITGLPWQ